MSASSTSRPYRPLARDPRRPGFDQPDDSAAMLAEHARELQLDLQVTAAEPDRAVRTRLLSEHAARASLIRRTCANVRAAILSQGSTCNEPALHRIADEVNDAVIAADLRAQVYRELSRP